MKNTVLMLFCIFPGVITLLIIMTIYGRINRSMELKGNLSSAMEETLANSKNSQNYKVETEQEFIADYVETLVYAVDAKTELQIDIFACDRDRGILSSRGKYLYAHPTGKAGSVEIERTVIYNKVREEVPLEKHKVEFYIEGDCYKCLEVCKNSIISPPKQPEILGESFWGWVDKDGIMADFANPVTENLIYYAAIK